MGWSLSGTYMESCSCEAICPCIVLSAPTEGTCSALVAWKIDEGHDGGVDLGNLNVALLVHTPGKMHETKWKVAVYVDDRASDEQKTSLLKIFGGQAGGHPAMLASFIGEMLGVKSAAIDFEKQGKNYVVKIRDVSETELEPLVGPSGGDVTVSNHLLAVSPGQPVVVARSKRSRIKDYDWDWNFDGRQCMYAPFAYEG
jgi:hypothetical protein